MSRRLHIILAGKQYNRYPGLLHITKLEHFLKHNPRYQNEVPIKTVEAILYSVRTKPTQRNDELWSVIKRTWPVGFDWTYIAGYGNHKTLNINLIDFSVLYNDVSFITQYPHIKQYLLGQIEC